MEHELRVGDKIRLKIDTTGTQLFIINDILPEGKSNVLTLSLERVEDEEKTPCALVGCFAGKTNHRHDGNGRILWPCSWHPGEYHNICSEAAN